MSRPWAEHVRLHLGAGSVQAARCRHLWKRRVLAQASAPMATRADLPGAVAAAVRACGVQPGAPVHWVLSSHWVQLQLAPNASALRGRHELHAAATHALQRVAGDATPTWQVRASRVGSQGLLCAGVQQSLLDELTTATAAAGLHMARCVPQVVQAWNRVRQRLPANGWLWVLENGRSTLVCMENNSPRAMLAQRQTALHTAGDWAAQLGLLRQRCRLQEAVGDPQAPCVVAACDTPPQALPGATVLQLSWLD